MLKASELAAACDAEVVGSADRMIAAVAPLEIARTCDLAWVGDVSRLADAMASSNAGVVLVPRGAELPDCDATFLLCRDLISARVLVIEALERHRSHSERADSAASVDPTARLGPEVVVSQHAIIGSAVVVGAGSWIGPNCVIGSGVELGKRCSVEAGSIIGAGTRIGDGCRIGPGAVIGSPPDAYEWREGGMRAIPSCGVVVLRDRVIVGAGTLIQRGVEKATIVGESTMIGSQCLIGHDSRVGMHSMVGAQSGLAAGCDVGDHVMISVQVGISIGVRVGNRARVGPKSGVMTNIPDGETWLGAPAEPKMTFLRQQAASRRLARHRPSTQPSVSSREPRRLP